MIQFSKQLLFQISTDMTSTIRGPTVHVCAPAPSLLTGLQAELLQFCLLGGGGAQGERRKPGRRERDSMDSQSQLSKSGAREGQQLHKVIITQAWKTPLRSANPPLRSANPPFPKE